MRSLRRSRAAAVAVVALCFLLVPASIHAQAGDRPSLAPREAPAPPAPALHSSAAPSGQWFHVVTATDGTSATDAQRGYGGRRGRGRRDRALVGFALGAVAGFAVGGAIGVAVESRNSCHCDDPALHGFLIGAPIGAGVGGLLGLALYH